MKLRVAPSPRTFSVTAGLLLAVLASACSTVGVKGTALPVSIVFTGAPPCPTAATVLPANQCPNVTDKRSCLKAKRGDAVVFSSAPEALDFTIYFDPFKKGALESKKGVLIQNVAPDAPYKTYNYNVVATGCPIFDPTIIIDP